MKRKSIYFIFFTTLISLFFNMVYGHGLMINPPARNAACGLAEDQKPNNATNHACIKAFEDTGEEGYRFMSVLTHTKGRQDKIDMLPKNVCGFNSEEWGKRDKKGRVIDVGEKIRKNHENITPWDRPLNWSTTVIEPGTLDITWNISWGPHFSDTEEFVYYITKPGFEYKVGTPLNWDNFESTPFCKEKYNDKKPKENRNIVKISDESGPNNEKHFFKTSCTVPNRSGRHVIYGEWGRRESTYERFHGCIDVAFNDSHGNKIPTAAPQEVTVNQNNTLGITLSGSDIDGTVESHSIKTKPRNGKLSGRGTSRLYTPNTDFYGKDSFTFTVKDNEGARSKPALVEIDVIPTSSGNKPPIASFSYITNNLMVKFNGKKESKDPDNSPQALSYSWDFGDGETANSKNPSHTYAAAGSYQVALSVSDGELSDTDTQTVTVATKGKKNTSNTCEHIINGEWEGGFNAEIRIINRGTTSINGWEVSWDYGDGRTVLETWNSQLRGTGPYTASNEEWNATIEPGKFASFGIKGVGDPAKSAGPVVVSGDACN